MTGYDAGMPLSLPAARDALDHPALTPAVRALARRGEVRSYRKGTLLIQEGDIGDTLYVILDGRLRVYGSDPRSGREVTYGHYGPGEYVGEMGLDGAPRSASVITVEPTLCSVVARPTLEQHLRDEPAFAFELLTKVIRRARAATLSTKQMALNDVYGRLKEYLEDQADTLPDGRRGLRQRPTHREISESLGCSREMVSRIMKELELGGYVEPMGPWLVFRRALPVRW